MDINSRDYVDLISNQNIIREALTAVMVKKRIGLVEIAKESNVAHVTMYKFMKLRKSIRWDTICKIIKYCRENSTDIK